MLSRIHRDGRRRQIPNLPLGLSYILDKDSPCKSIEKFNFLSILGFKSRDKWDILHLKILFLLNLVNVWNVKPIWKKIRRLTSGGATQRARAQTGRSGFESRLELKIFFFRSHKI